MLLDMLERLVMVLGVKNECWMCFWVKNRENSEQSPSSDSERGATYASGRGAFDELTDRGAPLGAGRGAPLAGRRSAP